MSNVQTTGTHSFNTFEVWKKYEDVAMHFNDLLMRLRSQSLAGIAAISTLVGIFTKGGTSDVHRDWLIATTIFSALACFWIAIACLDFFYYNRLLTGAVSAIIEIEKKSDVEDVQKLNLSTKIEAEFGQWVSFLRFKGVLLFYAIVFGVIGAGVMFSYCQMQTG